MKLRITADSMLNSKRLAEFMGYQSRWVISAIKKANAMAAARGEEKLIFSGRYSTARRIMRWLDQHPDFCASHVLTNRQTESRPSTPTSQAG